MKITIETPAPGQEDEIIIRCNQLDDKMMNLIHALKAGSYRLTAYSDQEISMLYPKDVYYFESVDNRVFAYCEKEVYEIRKKLYTLESELGGSDFLRISKSTIVNLAKISHLAPAFSGRLDATLKNGEKIVISRQYVPNLKKKLGI